MRLIFFFFSLIHFSSISLAQWNFQNTLESDSKLFEFLDPNQTLQDRDQIIPGEKRLDFSNQDKIQDQLQKIPFLQMSKASGGMGERVSQWNYAGVKESSPVLTWGLLDLKSELTHQGQSELVPLGDYQESYISQLGSIGGPSAQVGLGGLKEKGQVKFGANALGDYGLGIQSGKVGGGKISLNLNQTKNKRRYYNPQNDNWYNPQNDDEKFYSLNSEIEIDKKSTLSWLSSFATKGIPGKYYQNYQKLTEEKNLLLVGATRRYQSPWFQGTGAFTFKRYQVKLRDPLLESQKASQEFNQEDEQFAINLTAEQKLGNQEFLKFSMKGEMSKLSAHDEKKEADVYGRNRFGPKIEWKNRKIKTQGEILLIQNKFNNTELDERSKDYQMALSYRESWKGLFCEATASMVQRTPGLLQLFGNDSLYEGNPHLKPEKFPQGKLTIGHGAFFDNWEKSFIQLEVYHQRPKEIIVLNPSSFATWKASNVSKAWVLGSALAIAVDGDDAPFAISSNISYLDALNATEGSRFGKVLPLKPRWRSHQKLEVKFWSWFSPYISADFFDRYSVDEKNEIWASGGHQENLGFIGRWGNSHLELGVNNLFNRSTGNLIAENLVGNARRQLVTPEGDIIQPRYLHIELGHVF